MTRPIRVRAEAFGEYLRGALWALPTAAVILAFVLGWLLSQVTVGPDSWWWPLAFGGTPDDARSLLIAIASTMVTVLALVLGLTIVALQVSSTQFSPRLLRNFLRDRPTQLVLAVFVATFTYSTAGLYTVGVQAGNRINDYPRLAVTGAIVLLFISLGALVYFIDHVAHSIQIDTIMRTVTANTRHGVEALRRTGPDADRVGPAPPVGAVELTAPRSGYLQTVHPEWLVHPAAWQDAVISVVARPGDHLVAGVGPLAVAWSARGGPPRDVDALAHALHQAVQIGAERTLQHDPAFGLRQLVDIALRALSPAVNDPYTGVQSLDRLSTVIAQLAARPLGDDVHRDESGEQRAVAAHPPFAEYLDLACGQIRRYGAAEPAVCLALLRLLRVAGAATADPARRAAVTAQARLVLADAERLIRQPADLEPVRALAATVLRSPDTWSREP